MGFSLRSYWTRVERTIPLATFAPIRSGAEDFGREPEAFAALVLDQRASDAKLVRCLCDLVDNGETYGSLGLYTVLGAFVVRTSKDRPDELRLVAVGAATTIAALIYDAPGGTLIDTVTATCAALGEYTSTPSVALSSDTPYYVVLGMLAGVGATFEWARLEEFDGA